MAAFLFLKPSVAPLALFGARDRRWWALTAGLVGVSLLFLPLDLQWLTAIVNGQGDQSGLLYSLPRGDITLLSIPLIAWVGRSSQSGAAGLGGHARAPRPDRGRRKRVMWRQLPPPQGMRLVSGRSGLADMPSDAPGDHPTLPGRYP
jgi:hypothetical protein